MPKDLIGSLLSLSIEGPLLSEKEKSTSLNYLAVTIETTAPVFNRSVADKSSTVWKIPVSSRTVFDTIKPITRRNVFDVGMLNNDKLQSNDKYGLRIKFQTNSIEEFAIQFGYDMSPMNINVGVIYGGAILIILYGLIIFEVRQLNSTTINLGALKRFIYYYPQIVHRTFAAVMSSILTIAILTLQNDRPTMSDIVSYMDMEALLLLFSMTIVVAVLTETGVFDYLAYYSFKAGSRKNVSKI